MKREIIKIDEDLCNGCGLCVPNCHEGALQVIDDKVRLISDLMCDGLGACIGHCPEGAITIESREAEPYNETLVMEEMVNKGENTIKAHLEHLKEHGENEFLNEGIQYLKSHKQELNFNVHELVSGIVKGQGLAMEQQDSACGCPGSAPQQFNKPEANNNNSGVNEDSALAQWPVQLHLIHPGASYFKNSDLLVAADCTAFSLGGFHSRFLKDKSLVIACPKLDDGTDTYIEKLKSLIDDSMVNTVTVVIMEVPCCGGLLQMVKQAAEMATRKVPIKLIIAGVQGNILQEDWV